MSIFENLATRARQWPDRPAVVDDAGTLNYRDLWRETEKLRRELRQLGVSEGQGIGILARNGRGFVISMLAVLGCDAVAIPVYHQLEAREVEEIQRQTRMTAILVEGSGFRTHENGRQVIHVSSTLHLGFMPFANRSRTPSPDWSSDAAFVRYTSGTTGAAKGVVLTHQGVLERCRAANAGLGLNSEDKVLWVLPMAQHFVVSIVLYLGVGAAVVVCGDHWAGSILATARQHQVTFLYLTPMHVGLMAEDASHQCLPDSVKSVMSVSSPLPARVANAFRSRYGRHVSQGYGVIELGLPIMNLGDATEHPEAIGIPLPVYEVSIVDEAMNLVADGQTGQLALRGPGMFAGYLNPEIPCSEVLQDGWFLTGDLAHRHGSSGPITLDGRCKSVINVAGHKVFPEEVSGVLDEHPQVVRSRVVSRPHPLWGETVHAEVQLRNRHTEVRVEELLAFCRGRLARYKLPASIECVQEIQLTVTGKVRHG